MRHYHADTPIEVHFEPSHETPSFNDLGTPILTHGRHPEHGDGWTLSYLEPDGNGVEDYFIPGGLMDLDQVVKSAQDHLAWVGETAGDG